jgi:hypothetical protein
MLCAPPTAIYLAEKNLSFIFRLVNIGIPKGRILLKVEVDLFEADVCVEGGHFEQVEHSVNHVLIFLNLISLKGDDALPLWLSLPGAFMSGREYVFN